MCDDWRTGTGAWHDKDRCEWYLLGLLALVSVRFPLPALPGGRDLPWKPEVEGTHHRNRTGSRQTNQEPASWQEQRFGCQFGMKDERLSCAYSLRSIFPSLSWCLSDNGGISYCYSLHFIGCLIHPVSLLQALGYPCVCMNGEESENESRLCPWGVLERNGWGFRTLNLL